MTERAGEKLLLRRYTYKLYPNRAQSETLDRHRRMHCALYNALLQQRIDQWRGETQRRGKGERKSLGYYDQCKGLTALRNDPEIGAEWGALSSDSMCATAQRVDRAMHAFFRRAKAGAGAQSGFPRYQRGDDSGGISFKRHGSGWNVAWSSSGDARPCNGSLRIKGIDGRIRMRGRLPTRPEEIRTSDLCWRGGDWWLSLVVRMAARRASGVERGEVTFNLIDEFARVKRVDGGRTAGPEGDEAYLSQEGRISIRQKGVAGVALADSSAPSGDCGRSIRAPRARRYHLAETPAPTGDSGQRRRSEAKGLAEDSAPAGDSGENPGEERAMARRKRGSCRYRAAKRIKARREARIARRRREALHEWTTALARRFGELTLILPASIADATKSGRGDERNHGAAIKTKAAMNRAVLDQAPALAARMLEYKISEAGGKCTRIEDGAAPVLVGNEIVRTTRAVRSAARKVRRNKEQLHAA